MRLKLSLRKKDKSMRVHLKRRPWGGLMPMAAADADILDEFPIGAVLRCDVSLQKSPDQLRWYWALVSHVAQGLGMDKETLSIELLLRTGRFDAITLRDSAVHCQPKSIARMNHVQFREYVNAAVDLILAEYVQGITQQELLTEIRNQTGTNFSEFHENVAPRVAPSSGPRRGTETVRPDQLRSRKSSAA